MLTPTTPSAFIPVPTTSTMTGVSEAAEKEKVVEKSEGETRAVTANPTLGVVVSFVACDHMRE